MEEQILLFEEYNRDDIRELWENSFGSTEKLLHINQYAPSHIESLDMLQHFLLHRGDYRIWLIRRTEEQDIIGFIIHGDYFPGLPNNFGITIGLPYIGSGYGTASINKLCDILRETVLTEFYGHCLANNEAIISLMLKCGFENMGHVQNMMFHGQRVLKFRKSL
jgi:RimJ/RimL family protein N-acetyltransferase